MQLLHNLFKQNRVFFICFLLWYFVVSIFIFSFSKTEVFQLVNSNNSLFFDYFFTVITQFGDGILILALGILCFFIWSKRLGLAITVTYIGSGLICILLKKTFKLYRPGFHLYEDPSFHSLSWLPMANHNAFPSGHTTSAFALATAIALFSKNKKLGLIALCIACLTGYSRVYLGQHYMDDVWFGSMLGTGFSCLYAMLLNYYKTNKFNLTFFPPNFKI